MIADALKAVRHSVQLATEKYGRAPSSVRVVAVSKTKPVELLMEAYTAGQRHFGENYAKELKEKAPQMPADIQWHFIGNLQLNKAKMVAEIPNLYCVESVDTEKLANKLNTLRENKAPLKVMVQVNTSGEESKSGVSPEQCTELALHVANNCANLEFVGLMTIGRLGDISPECFQTLVKCRNVLTEQHPSAFPPVEKFELSMGMSSDFDVAIECGSTNVRIGSTIFGARDYTKK
mmetsp:Transcript_19271/g.31675  ORF Transcript_19271/g.31675 Transcript_19271/m.31675 type:complete len:234 (+) Transcript_19271:279-980(+)